MSRRALREVRAGFGLLVATELAYALLWPAPPTWPGIVIVALALVVGLLILLQE
jgi:hypothetical protein